MGIGDPPWHIMYATQTNTLRASIPIRTLHIPNKFPLVMSIFEGWFDLLERRYLYLLIEVCAFYKGSLSGTLYGHALLSRIKQGIISSLN